MTVFFLSSTAIEFFLMTMIFIRSIVAPSHWDTMSDKDSASLQAQSVAASQVAQTVTILFDCFSFNY